MLAPTAISGRREPWNKGKPVGQKAPLKLRDIWAIRVRLEIGDRKRELASFNLALDSKLRGCDLVQLRVRVGCGRGRRPSNRGTDLEWASSTRTRRSPPAAIGLREIEAS
jgi:hypothetical protein